MTLAPELDGALDVITALDGAGRGGVDRPHRSRHGDHPGGRRGRRLVGHAPVQRHARAAPPGPGAGRRRADRRPAAGRADRRRHPRRSAGGGAPSSGRSAIGSRSSPTPSPRSAWPTAPTGSTGARSSWPTAPSASPTARSPAARSRWTRRCGTWWRSPDCASEDAIHAASSAPAERRWATAPVVASSPVPAPTSCCSTTTAEVVATLVGGQVVHARPDAPTFP